VIYGGSSAAIVAATATVQKVIEEELQQVEFAKAPPPEPEPPPPPPEAAPPQAKNLRPKVKRPELVTPVKISDEKLKESDKKLAEAGESGPVDGFLDGVEGGTGNGHPPPPPPPPPPKAEPLVLPVAVGTLEKPKYSPSAKRKGIEGVVVVAFIVLEDGRVANPRIVSGPPEFHESVLRTALLWRFRPAHRGGKPVRYPMQRPVRFVLEDA
jgi:protein TonB